MPVGYGPLRNDKTGGPHSLVDKNERHYAGQSFLALQPYWIQLSMNPSTGSGGTSTAIPAGRTSSVTRM